MKRLAVEDHRDAAPIERVINKFVPMHFPFQHEQPEDATSPKRPGKFTKITPTEEETASIFNVLQQHERQGL